MNIKNIIDNMLFEEKESGVSYLNNVLKLQTRNIFEKYFKLSILAEYDKQDINHWKNEMFSGISLILTKYGGGVKEEKFRNIFNENFEKDVSNSYKFLYPKYENIIGSKEYYKNCEKIKINYLRFCSALTQFIYSSYKENNQKELMIDFLNKIF